MAQLYYFFPNMLFKTQINVLKFKNNLQERMVNESTVRKIDQSNANTYRIPSNIAIKCWYVVVSIVASVLSQILKETNDHGNSQEWQALITKFKRIKGTDSMAGACIYVLSTNWTYRKLL